MPKCEACGEEVETDEGTVRIETGPLTESGEVDFDEVYYYHEACIELPITKSAADASEGEVKDESSPTP